MLKGIKSVLKLKGKDDGKGEDDSRQGKFSERAHGAPQSRNLDYSPSRNSTRSINNTVQGIDEMPPVRMDSKPRPLYIPPRDPANIRGRPISRGSQPDSPNSRTPTDTRPPTGLTLSPFQGGTTISMNRETHMHTNPHVQTRRPSAAAVPPASIMRSASDTTVQNRGRMRASVEGIRRETGMLNAEINTLESPSVLETRMLGNLHKRGASWTPSGDGTASLPRGAGGGHSKSPSRVSGGLSARKPSTEGTNARNLMVLDSGTMRRGSAEVPSSKKEENGKRVGVNVGNVKKGGSASSLPMGNLKVQHVQAEEKRELAARNRDSFGAYRSDGPIGASLATPVEVAGA
ncbi:hypothetical protein HK097_004453 [Rhizophlyctis rosea]|uniref:Uncharacterized protein n=1 Tax=Rhizophlyctis rosea TaxID=64517 RepID=A0AAD5X5X6_9FUNG|nr:hypothetical protein HK097_004453 [Rhizophlyctis rosea]